MDASAVAESRAIHRATGPTFFLATRFLPRRVRRATYVLYAFFRLADEVVDDPGPASIDERKRRLQAIRRAVLGDREPTHPVLAAFRDLRREAAIPRSEVEVFLDAMATDLERDRYETRADLEAYMRGSSTAVAFMLLAVMDPDEPGLARPHARALGEAFQLTNFLRDVREDVLDRDRIYLPATVLDAHGSSQDELARLEPTRGIQAAVADELRRTEELYRIGVAGIRYLPRECQFPVLLAAVLYADHHRLIREQGFDVVSNAPSLSTPRKLWLVLATAGRWAFDRDPVSVFFDVSTVPRDSADDSLTDRVRRGGSRVRTVHESSSGESATDGAAASSTTSTEQRRDRFASLSSIKRSLTALLGVE